MKTLMYVKNNIFLFITTIMICCTLLSSFEPVFSQTGQQPKAKNRDDKKNEAVSFHVISDKMVSNRSTYTVEFIGNVKATRLDSIIYADSIKIFFHKNNSQKNQNPNKDKNTGQDNVKKIISTGNVKYTAGERKAFADKAVYTTSDQILILTGKTAKLTTGESFVTGKKITLYRIEDKIIVESDGTNRVEALFNPEDNKQNQAEQTDKGSTQSRINPIKDQTDRQ